VAAILPAVAIVVASAGLLYKLNHLRRNLADPALISLCMVFVFTLLAVVAGTFGGLHGAAFVTSTCLVILAVTNEQILLTYWTRTGRSPQSKVHEHLIVGISLVVSLAVAFPTGHIEVYLITYVVAHTAAETRIALFSCRHTRKANTPWLRRGLWTVSAGAILTLGDSVVRTVEILSGDLGLDTAAVLFSTTGATVKLIGWTLPGWGPLAADCARLLASHRDYRRMRPLWLALYRANPHIALDAPQSPVLEAVSVRDLEFKAYRRVIEIRDGVLALRPYMNPDLVGEARRRLLQAGLAEEELTATVDAVRIRAALLCKSLGTSLPRVPADRADEHFGGNDIPGERRWLSLVSGKFSDLH
jgi:hypothetical protein